MFDRDTQPYDSPGWSDSQQYGDVPEDAVVDSGRETDSYPNDSDIEAAAITAPPEWDSEPDTAEAPPRAQSLASLAVNQTTEVGDTDPDKGGDKPPTDDPPTEASTGNAPDDEPEQPYEGSAADTTELTSAAGIHPKGPLYHTLHPVGRYVAKDRSAQVMNTGDSVKIPTSLTDRTTFTKGSDEWNTNNTAEEYRETIFEDQRTELGADSAESPGTEAEAFADGKTVLDIGSGEAVALLQLAETHPATTFVGIDSGYKEVREIDPSKPGVQLTRDDWNTLQNVPSDSVDTLISQRGVIPWGISPDNPGSPQAADAITRVAKVGAVWRFEISGDPEFRAHITGLMAQRGWEVREFISTEGYLLRTMAAIKRR